MIKKYKIIKKCLYKRIHNNKKIRILNASAAKSKSENQTISFGRMAKIIHNGDAVILGNGGLLRIHKISVSGRTIKPSEFFKL